MKKLFKLIHHYAHAIECRSFLLSEYFYQRKRDNLSLNLFFKILKQPDVYEDGLNLLRFIRKEENVLLLDVGCNTGYWAENISNFFQNISIIGFEPDPRTYKTFVKRFRDRLNCAAYNVALSSAEGDETFHLAKNSTFSSFEIFDASQDDRGILFEESIKVKKSKLDSFELNVSEYDKIILKVDVQGHEIEMLRGAKNTLQNIDIAIIELSFANEYQDLEPSFARVTSILRNSDLFPVIFQDYGHSLSPYAWERDVIFVRQNLINKIWGW